MAVFYEGFKFRLMSTSMSGSVDVLDVTDMQSQEALDFVNAHNAAGTGVQVLRSYWTETILPFSYLPGNPPGI